VVVLTASEHLYIDDTYNLCIALPTAATRPNHNRRSELRVFRQSNSRALAAANNYDADEMCSYRDESHSWTKRLLLRE